MVFEIKSINKSFKMLIETNKKIACYCSRFGI